MLKVQWSENMTTFLFSIINLPKTQNWVLAERLWTFSRVKQHNNELINLFCFYFEPFRPLSFFKDKDLNSAENRCCGNFFWIFQFWCYFYLGSLMSWFAGLGLSWFIWSWNLFNLRFISWINLAPPIDRNKFSGLPIN